MTAVSLKMTSRLWDLGLEQAHLTEVVMDTKSLYYLSIVRLNISSDSILLNVFITVPRTRAGSSPSLINSSSPRASKLRTRAMP